MGPLGETANYENADNSTIIPFHMLGANIGHYTSLIYGEVSDFPADPGAYIANFFTSRHILYLGLSTKYALR